MARIEFIVPEFVSEVVAHIATIAAHHFADGSRKHMRYGGKMRWEWRVLLERIVGAKEQRGYRANQLDSSVHVSCSAPPGELPTTTLPIPL